MSRLYGTEYDKKRWKVKQFNDDDYPSYNLIDLENGEIYQFRNIIGFEQVCDDEFLVYKRYSYDEFQITRYKLNNSNKTKLFNKYFSKFYFINDDRIIFTNWGYTGPYRCEGIYSIKDNKIIEDGKWLYGSVIEIYEDKENKNEILICIRDEIKSSRLGNQKILYTVDPNTLQPNSDCYSSLRDSYIKVNNKDDIINIKEEDSYYCRRIEDYFFQQEMDQLKSAKEKILTRKK